MGTTFTVPDLLIGHCLGWAAMMKWVLPEGNVRTYFDRIRARPAFQTAMALRSAA